MESCTLRDVNVQVWWSFVLTLTPRKSENDSLVRWEIKKYLLLSANTLQFKVVCNREVDFMEILVVWGVLKYVPFSVDFVKWASIINCRRVTRNSLVFIKNGLCRIASCFRKNNLCLNFSFPDTWSLVYYHSSLPFKIDLV